MNVMLEQITSDAVFSHFLVFCRLGGALLLLPGLSEAYVSPRSRMIIAIGLTVVVTPITQPLLPALPPSGIELILLITKELIIGMFIGTMAKIILSTLHVAGMVMSYQMGLAAGTLFDPSQNSQGAIIGILLTFLGILLIFATDLHHIFLHGVVDSYKLFAPGPTLPLGGFADTVSQTASDAFNIGVKMAAPQIVVGLALYLAAGVMGRLMPQMQVFFVIIPVQILIGFFVLMITLSAFFMWFMDYYQEIMGTFIVFEENHG